jgi:hypothetical protein
MKLGIVASARSIRRLPKANLQSPSGPDLANLPCEPGNWHLSIGPGWWFSQSELSWTTRPELHLRAGGSLESPR